MKSDVASFSCFVILPFVMLNRVSKPGPRIFRPISNPISNLLRLLQRTCCKFLNARLDQTNKVAGVCDFIVVAFIFVHLLSKEIILSQLLIGSGPRMIGPRSYTKVFTATIASKALFP